MPLGSEELFIFKFAGYKDIIHFKFLNQNLSIYCYEFVLLCQDLSAIIFVELLFEASYDYLFCNKAEHYSVTENGIRIVQALYNKPIASKEEHI